MHQVRGEEQKWAVKKEGVLWYETLQSCRIGMFHSSTRVHTFRKISTWKALPHKNIEKCLSWLEIPWINDLFARNSSTNIHETTRKMFCGGKTNISPIFPHPKTMITKVRPQIVLCNGREPGLAFLFWSRCIFYLDLEFENSLCQNFGKASMEMYES